MVQIMAVLAYGLGRCVLCSAGSVLSPTTRPALLYNCRDLLDKQRMQMLDALVCFPVCPTAIPYSPVISLLFVSFMLHLCM